MSEPEARTTVVGSSVQFRVYYEQIKQLPIGNPILSDVVSAGGHLWRIEFFSGDDDVGISIYLRHMSKSRSARAIFEAFVMGRDGTPSKPAMQWLCQTFEASGDTKGNDNWGLLMVVPDLEKRFLIERHVTFVCTIMVTDHSPILVPPSDIGTHLGRLLDQTDGADVSFIIDDETFPAHRAVLAARSPVFKAELFGSMAESTMSSITLHDITPATFKTLLWFIYTDELPSQDEHQDSSTEMIQNLLVAADRYALDRLKIICAQKLWDKVSVDTVAAILGFAETYNCQELKNKCIDFFAVEINFKQVMFTDGYAMLLLKFPLIIAELKKRVGA
ncbi:BTB/POZ and MATH domain-containing protein 2-like [Lolium rigidum]|uniref:BTB/POZ and MATH domain-containing protein 2-like n=1 Tax=Lolium rigidum TaxID=89674 RepID=UPI001F5D28E3|nr:BTB/POZ and MATH domain-containing protein 2-like [Lolium rigidum]